jgi:serine/threonine protein kinase
VLGSPGYMAPEQARGSSSIDHRADIWAACVVLYECVTGQPAFQGENYNALMRAIIEEEVIPSTQIAAGDAALWSILHRGLEKDPARRWQSARELGSALAEWLTSHGIETDISGEPVRTWLEPESSKNRDLLSAPPPALPSDRSGVSLAKGETVAPPSSFRPAPESTSAVVRTNGPQRFSTRAPFILAITLLVVGATVGIVLATRGHSPAPGPSSSPVVGASIRQPGPVVTPAPAAPEPVVSPARERPEAPSKPEMKTPPVPEPPAQSRGTQAGVRRIQKKPVPPAGNSVRSDLKDPY